MYLITYRWPGILSGSSGFRCQSREFAASDTSWRVPECLFVELSDVSRTPDLDIGDLEDRVGYSTRQNPT